MPLLRGSDWRLGCECSAARTGEQDVCLHSKGWGRSTQDRMVHEEGSKILNNQVSTNSN